MYILGTQFRYTLKQVFMDRKSVILRILVFLLITFVLGNAFSSSFTKPDIDPVKVGYFSKDSGAASASYLQALSQMDALKDVTTFSEVDSFEEGEKKVESGELGALVFIDDGFSTKLSSGESATVEVYTKKYAGINYPVVNAVINAFNNGANANAVVKELGGTPGEIPQAVKLKTVNAERDMTGFRYYAVAMLLFLLLYGAEYGSFGGLGEDYMGALGDRMKLSLARPWQQYGGKLAAYSVAIFLQGAIFMGLTALLFRVDWGGNWPINLLVMYTFGLMAIALGMAGTAISGNMQRAKVILQACLLGFTFLGGGFIAATFGPISKLSPSLWARDAMFNVMFGESLAGAFRNTGIVAVFAVVFGAITLSAVKRRQA